jgi:ligand-binding SRPBCC domain-containing protein
VTTVECSVEIDAPAEAVWKVTSDPRNLPHWDKHIVAVHLPDDGLRPGARYDVVMSFMGVRATVPCSVLEWEPPWRAKVHLNGILNAMVTTSIASLPYERCVLRHEVDYVFRGPLGRFAAASVNAVGGAGLALRRGTLAQKREIEDRADAER